MANSPHTEHRAARSYVGIATTTSLEAEPAVIAKLATDLQRWLGTRALDVSGPKFVRYRTIEMPHRLDIEVCLPLDSPAKGAANVRVGSLPEGDYAVLTYTGPLAGLVDANAELQAWAEQQGMSFAMRLHGKASVWEARTETYLSDSDTDGQPTTEIAYLLAGERR